MPMPDPLQFGNGLESLEIARGEILAGLDLEGRELLAAPDQKIHRGAAFG
jgi:hypothetical protein